MNKILWFFVTLLAHFEMAKCSEILVPPCSSEIYCHGPLLHTIQMAKIYEDSKTFVDMKMRRPKNETLSRFDEFMKKYDNKPNKAQVREFVTKNFEEAGSEFEKWVPDDWKESPKFVEKIQDQKLRQFVLDLNKIWNKLGRKMKDEVMEHKELYSIIWVPHPVIVPGGRFREFYYWDSYWIICGLLLSEMVQTTRGMLENFLYMVDNYGHIPNGGRLYYLERSQPPLLIPMVKKYYDFTKDVGFLSNHIKTMEKEFDYWLQNHVVQVNMGSKNYTLAHYGDKSSGPRPESYSEDFRGAMYLNDTNKESFYSELKAAAESGWDFSSRWFITNATNNGNLTSIKTRSIVPVDLNALMYWNALLLGDFNEIVENEEKSNYYYGIAKDWMDAVTAVLWHEDIGVWLDYDISNNIRRDYFYPTNIAPLWTGCFNMAQAYTISQLVLKYLQKEDIINNPGGIPTTLKNTGEQWDYPNAWPPLQHMMVIALNNTGDKAAQRLAFEIAQKWIRSNYRAFQETSAMMEKYDATVAGASGSGGEYQVQEGFGWTNGVIMDLLDKYGDKIYLDDPVPLTAPNVQLNMATSSNTITTVLVVLLVSLTAGFIGICIYKRRLNQLSKSSKIAHGRVKYTELKNMRQGR